MLNSVLNGRKRAVIVSLVVISVTVLLLASWRSGAFEDTVLQSHAEAASGYTRDNTMSPLQGALIAATIVNDGVMMEPYLVQAVYHTDGTPMYAAQPAISSAAFSRPNGRRGFSA